MDVANRQKNRSEALSKLFDDSPAKKQVAVPAPVRSFLNSETEQFITRPPKNLFTSGCKATTLCFSSPLNSHGRRSDLMIDQDEPRRVPSPALAWSRTGREIVKTDT